MEQVGRVALLGNPRSGRGRGESRLRELEACVQARHGTPIVLPTSAPGDARRLASGLGEDVSTLLVIGGDGTLRDAVQGLHDAGRVGTVRVGILPAGTGNDLVRSLTAPNSPAELAELVASGNTRPIDLWLWNESVFVNVAGVGLDAAVAQAVNSRFTWLTGAPAYATALLCTLPRFNPPPIEMRLVGDDGAELAYAGSAWLVAFGNGACYGGGMRIAPDAVIDDGLLDVVLVGDIPRLELLRQFPSIFSGGHVRHPGVRSWRVREVQVDSTSVLVPTLDGELLDGTPARIRPSGAKLQWLTPRDRTSAPA